MFCVALFNFAAFVSWLIVLFFSFSHIRSSQRSKSTSDNLEGFIVDDDEEAEGEAEGEEKEDGNSSDDSALQTALALSVATAGARPPHCAPSKLPQKVADESSSGVHDEDASPPRKRTRGKRDATTYVLPFPYLLRIFSLLLRYRVDKRTQKF